MTRLAEVEELLDTDPLAVRLTHVGLPPLSARHRSVLAGSATVARSSARRPRRRYAVAVAVVAAISVVLTITPVGAAIGRAVLPAGLQQRLGLVEGAPSVLTPPSRVAGAAGRRATATTGPCSFSSTSKRFPTVTGPVECTPSLSLADAQRQVAFRIPVPSVLPQGVTYRGALVLAPHTVYLSYGRPGDQPGAVGLSVRDDAPVGGPAVPAGAAQAVAFGDGTVGYFVRGAYDDNGPGTPAHWDPSADDVELTWQRGTITFDLTAGALHLGEADLLKIAQSVG